VKTVSLDQVGREEPPLPPRVQELGEFVGSAREGLLALSVGVGLGVPVELLEEEFVEVVGPKARHIPERAAVRHGHEAGEVTLGGRREAVERPRVRSADGRSDVLLATYQYFAGGEPPGRVLRDNTDRYRRHGLTTYTPANPPLSRRETQWPTPPRPIPTSTR
jgi:putative transposase